MRKISEMKQILIRNRQKEPFFVKRPQNNSLQGMSASKRQQLPKLAGIKSFQKTQREYKRNTSSKSRSSFNTRITPQKYKKIQPLPLWQCEGHIEGNSQQLKMERLSKTFEPIVPPSTLSQYIIYLQQFYKAQNTPLILKKEQNSQIVQINLQPLKKWLQLIQVSIKDKIKTITEQRQQYFLMKKCIDKNVPMLMKKNDNSQESKSYSQILWNFINNCLNKERETDIKLLKLGRQLSSLKSSKKTGLKNNILSQQTLSNNNQYFQKVELLKRENEFLRQRKKQMQELINILKIKNKQLNYQIEKKKGQNSSITNRFNSTFNNKLQQSGYQLPINSYLKVQNNQSLNNFFPTSSFSNSCKPNKQNFFFDQPYKIFPKKEKQEKTLQFRILTSRLKEKQEKLNNHSNSFINQERKRLIISHSRHKSSENNVKEKRAIQNEVNLTIRTAKSGKETQNIEKLKIFKKQVQELLIKSEEKIKTQDNKIKQLQQKIKVFSIQIKKILKLFKIKESPVVQNHDIIQSLTDIYQFFSTKIDNESSFNQFFSLNSSIDQTLKNPNQQNQLTLKIQKAKYREQIVDAIEMIKNLQKKQKGKVNFSLPPNQNTKQVPQNLLQTKSKKQFMLILNKIHQ